MNDFILNIVKFNEQIDFNILIPFVILYVLTFWLIVSIWVYLDSKLRYESRKKAILLAILNQIFGVPFLLLYILARPFIPEEQTNLQEVEGTNGGVNVPIVNFIGKKGVVMSLQLAINSQALTPENDNPEMTIDVNFNTSDQEKVLIEKVEEKKEEKKIKAVNFAGKIMAFFKKTKPKVIIEEQTDKPEDKEVNLEIKEPVKSKKKKGKKKRR